MASDPLSQSEFRAIERLGWSASDLYLAALGYGDVGSLDDVEEHLRTGDHLSPEQKQYVLAALWDAELDAADELDATEKPPETAVASRRPDDGRRVGGADGSRDWASTYLSVAAHDIRGPLAAIKGFADMLLAEGHEMGPDESRDMLARISQIAARMDLAARNILDTDRVERGGLHLDVQDIALSEVWDLAVEDLPSADHHLATDLAIQTVPADRSVLQRIVCNLLANAVTHTPKGTNVVLRSWREDHTAIVAVDDDGPGLPQDLVAALNSPDGDGYLSQTWTGGSGLGLALVRRLAQLHSGTLTAHNHEGGGASFHVRLPDPSLAAAAPPAGPA